MHETLIIFTVSKSLSKGKIDAKPAKIQIFVHILQIVIVFAGLFFAFKSMREHLIGFAIARTFLAVLIGYLVSDLDELTPKLLGLSSATFGMALAMIAAKLAAGMRKKGSDDDKKDKEVMHNFRHNGVTKKHSSRRHSI